MYKREYQESVDTAFHAKIIQDEILDIQESLQKNKSQVQEVDLNITQALSSVADIINTGFPGSGEIEATDDDINQKITTLNSDIIDVENRHQSADFAETGELISKLEQFLQQQLSESRTYKADFTIDSLRENEEFLGFAEALSNLANVQEGKSDAIEQASDNEQEWQEALYEERQNKAKHINWIVTGLCIVGSAVATVATGGAATPLFIATISGVSGAVMSGTQSITSQYVVSGDWDKTNWEEVGKSALIGGVEGFVAGYIGGEFTKVVTGGLSGTSFVGELLNSGSTATRVGTNAVIGASLQTLSGMGSRFAGTMISSGRDLDASIRAATDIKSILLDATIGGTAGAVNGIKKPSISKMMSEEDATKYEDFLKNGSQEGLTEAEVQGIAKVDEQLALNKVNYDEVLEMRRVSNGTEGVGDAKFKYKNNPSNNPKVLINAVENPNAVYGYSPNPEPPSRIKEFASTKYDWTNPEKVAKYKKIRIKYHEANDNISELVISMSKEGASLEEIARAANNQRNQNRLNSYIKRNDFEGLAKVKASNLREYGYEDGLRFEDALKKYGSFEKVIEGAMGANPGMDACCGLYDEYFHLYKMN